MRKPAEPMPGPTRHGSLAHAREPIPPFSDSLKFDAKTATEPLRFWFASELRAGRLPALRWIGQRADLSQLLGGSLQDRCRPGMQSGVLSAENGGSRDLCAPNHHRLIWRPPVFANPSPQVPLPRGVTKSRIWNRSARTATRSSIRNDPSESVKPHVQSPKHSHAYSFLCTHGRTHYTLDCTDKSCAGLSNMRPRSLHENSGQAHIRGSDSTTLELPTGFLI